MNYLTNPIIILAFIIGLMLGFILRAKLRNLREQDLICETCGEEFKDKEDAILHGCEFEGNSIYCNKCK